MSNENMGCETLGMDVIILSLRAPDIPTLNLALINASL